MTRFFSKKIEKALFSKKKDRHIRDKAPKDQGDESKT
jgi:hypothetical protein